MPRAPAGAAWSAVLLALSTILVLLLNQAHLPAALMLGPMIAGIVVAASGARLSLPKHPVLLAQSVIGGMIASAITPAILVTIGTHLPLFLGVVLATIALSTLLGWLLSRLQLLPGSTAIWGSSPGAASAMMLMAEAFGADPRLVAFMQYLRVVFVAIAASLIAQTWAASGQDSLRPVVWFPALPPLRFGLTLALLAGCAIAGRRLRLPGGPLLMAIAVVALLNVCGLFHLLLPHWLLAAAYALLGWRIGLGFTRPIIATALHALMPILASIALLMGFGGLLAWLLHRSLGVDPLTAYLATSPGGLDSVAVIAASSRVDMPFIIGLQTLRFLLVLALAPVLSRAVARRLPAPWRDEAAARGTGAG